MPKKAKKGKGKKKPPGPPIITTQEIINGRAKMLAPRMGDMYTKTIEVEAILEECVARILQKTADKQSNSLNLACMKLSQIPDITR